MVQPTERSTTSVSIPAIRAVPNEREVPRVSRAAAAHRIYEQECALHDAHGSGVATWIARAEQTLHAAILMYEVAEPAA